MDNKLLQLRLAFLDARGELLHVDPRDVVVIHLLGPRDQLRRCVLLYYGQCNSVIFVVLRPGSSTVGRR